MMNIDESVPTTAVGHGHVTRRDDVLAKEEIFDGMMGKVFSLVAEELLLLSTYTPHEINDDGGGGGDERREVSPARRDCRDILKVLPPTYYELFLLYNHYTQLANENNKTRINSVSAGDPMAQVTAYLEWRQKLQLQYNSIDVSEILGGVEDIREIFRLMPECLCGRDKDGQPVLYFRFSGETYNMVDVMKKVTTKNIFDYHLWQHEATVEFFYHLSCTENRFVTACTLVLDIGGLDTEKVSSEFLHVINRRADLCNQYFPYLVNRVLVINANLRDQRLVSKMKDFCVTLAPTAEVLFADSEKKSLELLSQHIDGGELPAEYAGPSSLSTRSLASLSHPFEEPLQARSAAAKSSVLTSSGLSDAGRERGSPLLSLHRNQQLLQQQQSEQTQPQEKQRSASPTANIDSNTTDEEDSLFPPQSRQSSSQSFSNLASVDSQSNRTFSSCSSKVPTNQFARSMSICSPSTGGSQLSRAELMLTSIPMTPNARVALTAFIELFASNDIPITPAASVQSDGSGKDHENNIVLTTSIDPNVFSIVRDGCSATSVGCDVFTSLTFRGKRASSFFDTLAIRTASGVAVLQKRQGDHRKLSALDLEEERGAEYSQTSPVLPICCRKYLGAFVLSHGRVYSLSRGVSLSGWLQKWPMKSQGLGGATQRYFVLDSCHLRYWKAAPSRSRASDRSSTVTRKAGDNDNGNMFQAQLEPCKGQLVLTHQTTLKRAKTLFGNNTIEIKTEDDSLTICAYTVAEDMAWFSELTYAIDKLKKSHRDVVTSEVNFPELIWRSPEPSCVAIDVDVVDPLNFEEGQEREEWNSTVMPSDRNRQDETATQFRGEYAVLCRVSTGLSTTHSVQIGPFHHIPIRLENSDIDAGVQLMAVRLCGDCLVVSGSNGFVGSGRIPPLTGSESTSPMATVDRGSVSTAFTSPTSTADSSGSSASSQRIYVRRMMNCFHGEDARVTCLAIPRALTFSQPVNRQGRHGGGNAIHSSTASVLASGDEIGGVCVWRREEGGRGVLHFPTYDGQQSKNTHRAGYSWQCVHRARIGHKITALSFSPDGKILSVTTPERAVLFDISQLLLEATRTPDKKLNSTHSLSSMVAAKQQRKMENAPTSDEDSEKHLFAVRSVVLDDLVGCNYSNSTLSYGVDLSSQGFVKLWKISSGSESKSSSQKGDKIQFMESKLDSLFNRLRDVKYVKPLRDLFPNAVSMKNNFNREYGQPESERKLISLSQDVDVDMRLNIPIGSVGLSSDEKKNDVVSKDPPYTGNHERDGSVLDGYSIDPFYYSDLCVIDPIRMHLRDWWCDYSSRYLLLGHTRLSSLSTFETSIISTTPHTTSVAGSLSSLSRSLNESSLYHNVSGGVGTSYAANNNDFQNFLEAGRGLDRQSTTMFWSTLTNSLGRRVICRYYIPNGYYTRLRNSESAATLTVNARKDRNKLGASTAANIAPLLEDCLRFCLTLSRCLYECLGDEYVNSLLISWKAVALDTLREILERKSHSVFKDLSIFQDILCRFELSPDLALSSLNDLIGVMENIKQWQAEQPRQTSPTLETSKSVHLLTSPLTSIYIETFFKNIRDALSIVYDEQGLQCTIPSSRMIYLLNGGVPPLNSANFQQVVEDYMIALQKLDTHSSICSIMHLLQSLVIDPLNHFERTEPFAVALCIVGLKGVPAYINDVIIASQSNTNRSSSDPVAEEKAKFAGAGHSNSYQTQSGANKQQTDSPAVYKDITIESLISKIAKETPPWIRFILTSDTDKVTH